MKLTFNLKEIKGRTQPVVRRPFSGRPIARMPIGREGVPKLTSLNRYGWRGVEPGKGSPIEHV